MKIDMKPAHPGNFIREEVINEPGLTIKAAAKVFGARDATLSDFLKEGSTFSRDGSAARKGI